MANVPSRGPSVNLKAPSSQRGACLSFPALISEEGMWGPLSNAWGDRWEVSSGRSTTRKKMSSTTPPQVCNSVATGKCLSGQLFPQVLPYHPRQWTGEATQLCAATLWNITQP